MNINLTANLTLTPTVNPTTNPTVNLIMKTKRGFKRYPTGKIYYQLFPSSSTTFTTRKDWVSLN